MKKIILKFTEFQKGFIIGVWLIVFTLIITLVLSSCKTVQVPTNIDYYKSIKNLTYTTCVTTRIGRFHSKGYTTTDKGELSVYAGCYTTLRAAGVLR